MEWKNPENKSWLLMVQWHPERMSDLSSPFSAFVKNAFLDACQNCKDGLVWRFTKIRVVENP